MAGKAPGIWSLVLVPAIVSLLVTVLRLVGELQGWNDMLFSNVAPGGEPKLGLVGISWLIPIFGCWFGFRLRKATGQPSRVGRSAVIYVAGAVVLVGGFFALMASGLIVMPGEDEPGTPQGLMYSLAVVAVAAVVMLTAWPRLGVTLLVYAALARIPVIVVTWLALENDWQTHHTKLPVGTVLPEGTTPFTYLMMPQITFWPVATLMAGGLFGCLGAALAGKPSK